MHLKASLRVMNRRIKNLPSLKFSGNKIDFQATGIASPSMREGGEVTGTWELDVVHDGFEESAQ